MREHLYRAQRCDNKEWIYGYYVKSKFVNGEIVHFIIDADATYYDYDGFDNLVEVIPETIGEYTGLTDKNGKKIWENDIMTFYAYGFDYNGVVTYINGSFCVICVNPEASPFLDDVALKRGGEVIGTIFDEGERDVSRKMSSLWVYGNHIQ